MTEGIVDEMKEEMKEDIEEEMIGRRDEFKNECTIIT